MSESPQELAEWLANGIGLDADPECDYFLTKSLSHSENCLCRSKWVPAVAQRIRDAALDEYRVRLGRAVSRALAGGTPQVKQMPQGTLLNYNQNNMETINRILEEELGITLREGELEIMPPDVHEETAVPSSISSKEED